MAVPVNPPPDVTMPERLPYRQPSYDTPAPLPIPMIPALNFRDQRYQRDMTPQPPGPTRPPDNLAALISLLNRLYG